MVLKRTLLAFFIVLGSCTQARDGEALKNARRLFDQYLLTKDKEYLQKSYEQLKSTNDFAVRGLTQQNHDLAASVLMYLRKYDEMEKLVEKSDSIIIPKKDIVLNLVRSLKEWDKDSLVALQYIDKNIEAINKKIGESPKDSLLYVDLFVMRMYKVGRQKTILEVDSFRQVDRTFSTSFHDHVLRDVIEGYPIELLFPNKK